MDRFNKLTSSTRKDNRELYADSCESRLETLNAVWHRKGSRQADPAIHAFPITTAKATALFLHVLIVQGKVSRP